MSLTRGRTTATFFKKGTLVIAQVPNTLSNYKARVAKDASRDVDPSVHVKFQGGAAVIPIPWTYIFDPYVDKPPPRVTPVVDLTIDLDPDPVPVTQLPSTPAPVSQSQPLITIDLDSPESPPRPNPSSSQPSQHPKTPSAPPHPQPIPPPTPPSPAHHITNTIHHPIANPTVYSKHQPIAQPSLRPVHHPIARPTPQPPPPEPTPHPTPHLSNPTHQPRPLPTSIPTLSSREKPRRHAPREQPLPPRHPSSTAFSVRIPRKVPQVSSDPTHNKQSATTSPVPIPHHPFKAHRPPEPNSRNEDEIQPLPQSSKPPSRPPSKRPPTNHSRNPPQSQTAKAILSSMMMQKKDSTTAKPLNGPIANPLNLPNITRRHPLTSSVDLPPPPRNPVSRSDADSHYRQPWSLQSHPPNGGDSNQRDGYDVNSEGVHQPRRRLHDQQEQHQQPKKKTRVNYIRDDLDPFASLTERHFELYDEEPVRVAEDFIPPTKFPMNDSPDAEVTLAQSSADVLDEIESPMEIVMDKEDATHDNVIDVDANTQSKQRSSGRKKSNPIHLLPRTRPRSNQTDTHESSGRGNHRFRIISNTPSYDRNDPSADFWKIRLYSCVCGFNQESQADIDRRSSGFIQCGQCSYWSHLRCTQLSEEDIENYSHPDGKRFLCWRCAETLQQHAGEHDINLRSGRWGIQVKPETTPTTAYIYDMLLTKRVGPLKRNALVRNPLSEEERLNRANNVELLREGLIATSIGDGERSTIDRLSEVKRREQISKDLKS